MTLKSVARLFQSALVKRTETDLSVGASAVIVHELERVAVRGHRPSGVGPKPVLTTVRGHRPSARFDHRPKTCQHIDIVDTHS